MARESDSGAARFERALSDGGIAPALRGGAMSMTRYTSARRGVAGFGGLAVVLGLLGGQGCAGASPEPPPLDAAFARIQVHEAAIERARLDVQRSDTECGQACAAAGSADREQSALCTLARDVDDRDALTRCGRARHAAASLNAQAARRCRCP